MGIIASGKYPEEIRGQHVPMITESQFYRVQAILDGRNPNFVKVKRNYDKTKFKLRRIVKCARCGIGLTAAWSKGRHASYAYYRCSGKCSNASIKKRDIDDAVIAMLKQITPTPECLDLLSVLLKKRIIIV